MKRVFVPILCAIMVVLLCTGCQYETVYYQESDSPIRCIEIVSANSSTDYGVLKTLSEDEMDSLLISLKKMPFIKQAVILDPPTLSGNALVITYESGEYEMIAPSGWEKVKEGQVTYMWAYCNRKDFDPLIEAYLAEK